MLYALTGKVILKKIEKEEIPIGPIYMPVRQSLFEIVNINPENSLIKAGDHVIIKSEALFSVYHNGNEYFIALIEDILAKVD